MSCDMSKTNMCSHVHVLTGIVVGMRVGLSVGAKARRHEEG